MPYWTKRCTFVTGVARYPDLVYFSLQDDLNDANKEPHSIFTILDNGEWLDGGVYPWSAVNMSICKHPLEQMFAIGPNGNVLLIGGDDLHEEKIETNGRPLRHIRGI